MQQQARQSTGLELALRKALHKRGMRYRVQRQLIQRRTSDIVFPSARVVVDVRACFWHRCAVHCKVPNSNADWWRTKLERTAERDADTELKLAAAGWLVLVVWEHDDLEEIADRICSVVRSRR
jgi:DNA mismatch endonuclease, patch repair protein